MSLPIRLCLFFCVVGLLSSCAAMSPKKKVEQKKIEQNIPKEGSNTIRKISLQKEGNALALFFESLGRVNYTAFKLNSPLRLVFDFNDIEPGDVKTPASLPQSPVKNVKTQYFPATKNMRVELFLEEAIEHEIFRLSDIELKVVLTPKEKKKESAPAVARSTVEKKESVSTDAPKVTVFNLDFMAVPEKKSRVIVHLRGGKPSFTIVKDRKKKKLVLDIENATITGKGAKELDTSQVSPLVKQVKSFQLPGKGAVPGVRVQVDLLSNVGYNIYRDGESLLIDLEKGSEAIPSKAGGGPGASGGSSGLTGRDQPGAGKKAVRQQRVSMDFYEADIVNVLKLIADVSHMNIITGDGVTGKVTMRLVNVPWEQALSVVLKTAKLGMIQEGNIIRVAPLANIIAEKKAETDAKMADIETSVAEEDMEKLSLEILPVNYAKANDMLPHLDKIKGARGNISIDTRTNSLILRDTVNRISSMKTLVQSLDVRTPQVLIEARIVEVNRDFTHTLGIQWGGKTGLTTGVGFPATVGASASVLGGSVGPISASGGTDGTIAATLGSVTGTTSLDLKLSALENESKARILSTPRVVTSDNQPAKISSGSKVPFETVSSSGTQTQFLEVALTLNVTPHVTRDGYVSLDISATKNEIDVNNNILIKEAKTMVLIRDGETTVIGGIYKTTVSDGTTKVPWFSKIPFLGWLFKTETKGDKGEELLIFITPRILKT
ncbi:MAG: type IV pilus secretin PilQ [Nitrospinota bacterium]